MKKTDLYIVLSVIVLFSSNVWAKRLYWGDGYWGNVNHIKSCNPDGSDVGTVIELDTGYYGAVDVDIHEIDSKIYWVSAWGLIERCNLDGTGYERVADIDNAYTDELFVNEVNSKIYFTDTNVIDAICRIDLDGSHYAEIITEYVKCFDVDPVNSKIYYVTLYKYDPPWDNLAGRIWHANLDGSDKTMVFEYNDNEWPEQIALDLSEEKLYWKTTRGRFQRADFDGSNAEIIFAPTDFFCSGLVIDEIDDKIYWINRTARKLQRANLDGTDMEDVVTTLSPDPYGLTLEVGPVCGDSEHPVPVGDINMDCVVNMDDFALLCNHWFEDNRPQQVE